MEKDKDKVDAPKQKQSVVDYWISLDMKERKPGEPSGFVIGTGGKPVAKKDDQPK
jgi:hypothetical protein